MPIDKDKNISIDNHYEYRFNKVETIKKYLENKKKIRAKYKTLNRKNYKNQELYCSIMDPELAKKIKNDN